MIRDETYHAQPFRVSVFPSYETWRLAILTSLMYDTVRLETPP